MQIRTVTNSAKGTVAEDMGLVPVREVARLLQIPIREDTRKCHVVDRLHVHEVEDLLRREPSGYVTTSEKWDPFAHSTAYGRNVSKLATPVW